MYNPGPKVKPVELRTTTTDLYENRFVEQSKTIHLPMQFMTRDVFLNIWKREKKSWQCGFVVMAIIRHEILVPSEHT